MPAERVESGATHTFVERADRYEAPYFPRWLYCRDCGMSDDFAKHSGIGCRAALASLTPDSPAGGTDDA